MYCLCFGLYFFIFFFFSSRRRHTRLVSDWSSDVCSSDLIPQIPGSPSLASPATSAWIPLRITTHASYTVRFSRQRRALRSEERRVGKSVDLGGRRIIKKKNVNDTK